MRDLLLIAIVALCSLVGLVRPFFGLLTFVCLGLLNPDSMVWGIGQTFPLSQMVAVATILGYLISAEPKTLPRQREVFFLLALWSMFGISTLLAIYPDKALTRFIYVSKILLMMFIAMSLINTEDRLRSLLRVIALSLGFYGLKGGLFSLMTGGSMVWGPEGSFLYANNSIGLALDINIPILWYLLKVESHPWLRRILRGMLILSYPAVVFTYSRGAWIGLGVVTTIFFLRSRYKVLIVTISSLVGVMVFSSLPYFLPQHLVDRYDQLINYQEEGGAQSRFWNWEFCKRVGLANPLHGGGFEFYSLENYAVYFPEFLERYPTKLWSCHSIWYTMLGEHGFPGLFLWVGLLGSCFFSVMRIRSYGRDHAERVWFNHCADMLQAALLAFSIVGTFLDAAYFDIFYYVVAILIVVKEKARREAVEEHAEASAIGTNRPMLGARAFLSVDRR